jgi:peptidoglycan/LPS O-acetylase OafA/YrhL
MTFYLVLPVFVLASRGWTVRRRLQAIALLGAGSAALRIGLYPIHPYPLNVTLAGTGLWFAIGMALAVLSAQCPSGRVLSFASRRPALLWAASASVLIGMTRIGLPLRFELTYTTAGWAAEHLGYALVAALALLPLVAAPERRWLTWRPLTWLGEISYGFYLWHLPLVFVFVRLGVVQRFPRSPFLALTLCVFAGAVVCGALSYYFIERPLLRLGSARRAHPGIVEEQPVLAAG